MPKLTANVANCLLSGEEITRHADGSWTRDIVRFACNGRLVSFRQRRDIAIGKFTAWIDQFCETSDVEVEVATLEEAHDVLADIDDICWLLSFALQSPVVRYGHQLPDGTGQFRSVVGVANCFRPCFHPADAATARDFVEQTHATFALLNGKRNLSTIFDYLIQADRPNQPLEIRLILSFVALESLKDTYAREMNIPYVRGFYRRSPTRRGRIGARIGFEELLGAMFRAVRMKPGLKQIVALRNELIHSGLSRKPFHVQWKKYERSQDLIREYILRLLGYRGSFNPYSDSRRPKRF